MLTQRRQFLRAAAAGGVAYAFGRTAGTIQAQMSAVGGFPDYKALVCLFLFGGNDSWNMFVPTSTAEFNAYYKARSGGTSASIAIEKSALLSVTQAGQVAGDPTYGFHPSLGGARDLFAAGKLAVVANVGPLIKPTTKAQYTTATTTGHPLPPQLFSHNDQQDQWHSLRAKAVVRSGWAGRIADVLNAQVGGQQLAVNLSLAGQTFFQAGDVVTPFVMGSTGATTLTGFGTTGTALGRRNAVQSVLSAATGSSSNTIYERAQAQVTQRAVQYADRINTTLAGSPNFTALPNTGVTLSALATQLRTVAKMIAARSQLSMTRQIFFVSIGGFDLHDNLNTQHPGLLASIGDGVKSFFGALAEIGMEQSVTLFTQSDFARTLTSNGDGSDHAWGGVQLVAGGAVRGGRVYGQYPLIEIGAAQDVGAGRLIPTTSADQYAATLASWFGVQDADLAKIAPSLANFTQRNLGFMV